MSEEASRWKKFLTRQGIVFHQKLLCSEVFDNVKDCLSQEKIMVLEKILAGRRVLESIFCTMKRHSLKLFKKF